MSATASSSPESATFLEHILRGDRVAAHRLAKHCLEHEGPLFLYEGVVCPAMREVGELWSRDRITVADEHLATATASAAIAGLYPYFPWPRARSARILIACAQGEQHAFGARVLADLLALDGWEEVYFGADVPLETLAPKTAELNPRVIALSVTLAQNLDAARAAVREVRATRAETKIILGGRAVTIAPDRAAAVGADATAATAAQAVETVRGWRI